MLKKITLDKAWYKSRKGSTIEVDSIRAKWLEDNGFDANVNAKKQEEE